MTGAIVFTYLGGWLLTSIAALLISKRAGSATSSPRHSGRLSILAGIVWPVIVCGVVELWAIAVIARALREDDVPLTVEALFGSAPDGATCKDQLSY